MGQKPLAKTCVTKTVVFGQVEHLPENVVHGAVQNPRPK